MVKTKLKKQLENDRALLKRVNNRLNNSPKGMLHVHKRKDGRISYTVYYPQTETATARNVYLSKKDTESLRKHTDKIYLQKLKAILQQEIELIEHFLERYSPDIKETLNEKLSSDYSFPIPNLAKSIEELAAEWEAAPYKRNMKPFENNLFYETKKGDRVRSRGECIIADILHDAGLHYRCECALRLKSGMEKYPDFTVIHPKTGEIWYIEFFGMMDDSAYARINFAKIHDYAFDPMYSRFIPVFDYQPDAPFSPQMFRQIVKSVFLA